MQPTRDPAQDQGPSPLRRWGPIAVVLAVVIGVAAFGLTRAGDDVADPEPEPEPGEEVEMPEGAVTWSMAEEQGLDVEFPDTCDQETGMVAIPFLFRSECFADVEDNGGATADGVTGDSIKIVAWLPAEDDPVRALVLQQVGFDATNAELQETYEGFIEIFQRYYQTYGRQVEVEFIEASGTILDPTAARADAVRVAEDMQPFAVVGGPIIGGEWTEEIHSRGIVCLACPGMGGDPAPSSFSLPPARSQVRAHVVEYVSTKLAGGTADFAGDELQGEERVFGHLQLGISEADERAAESLSNALEEAGVELAEQTLYPLDPGRAAELSTSAIARMQASGVTTVLVETDPILLANFTQEATRQEWFPEWVLVGSPFIDTTAFARTFDQEQWQHAFGISYFPPQLAPAANPPSVLYEWFHGEPPPVEGAIPLLLLYPQVTLFFTGVQYAGPDLTLETFRDGLFAMPPSPRMRTQPSISFGTHRWTEPSYAAVDDMVELWWDPDLTGPDEGGAEGQGTYRYVDGAQRHLVGEWPEELNVFEEEGSVSRIEDPPEDEVPPDYPPPGGA
jgi:hypothetical protein